MATPHSTSRLMGRSRPWTRMVTTCRAPLEETFALENGHAQWKSHEETGDDPVSAARVLHAHRGCARIDRPPRAGAPQSRRHDGAPSGRRGAHREVGDATVTAAGATKQLTAYDDHRDRSDPDACVDGGPTARWFGFIDPGFRSSRRGGRGDRFARRRAARDRPRAREANRHRARAQAARRPGSRSCTRVCSTSSAARG